MWTIHSAPSLVCVWPDERQAHQQQPGQQDDGPVGMMLGRTYHYQRKQNHAEHKANDPDLSKARLTQHRDRRYFFFSIL
jgi:hypothetical protein